MTGAHVDTRSLQENVLFGPVTEYEVVRFLESLLDLCGKIERYPISSKIVQEGGAQAAASLARLWEKPGDDATISELYNQLQVNDIPLSNAAQTHPTVSAFLYFMLENNVRAVTFHANAKDEDLVRFFSALVNATAGRDLDDELRGLGLASIDYLPQVTIPAPPENAPRVSFARTDGFFTDTGEDSEDDVAWEDVPVERNAPEEPAEPATEAASDAPGKRIHVRVVVGTHPLFGATVTVVDHLHPTVVFDAEPGATLQLIPGDYALEVRYEAYRVMHPLKVGYDDDVRNIDVDLQRVFDY
ncbi:MAG: hypothetical protein IT350_07065 [Deltaproteobacteria bacterium]|nr:hypothetical protein [Deltaproteobacteria bacterium]